VTPTRESGLPEGLSLSVHLMGLRTPIRQAELGRRKQQRSGGMLINVPLDDTRLRVATAHRTLAIGRHHHNE
jgi:hypothetical protein